MTVELFDHQVEYLDQLPLFDGRRWPRTCLYFRTGAGKTLTALLALERWGAKHALVIAPPSTHGQWEDAGAAVGIRIDTMSHAKFRMSDTRVSRVMPLIVDEFHLLGGVKGKGFRKMQTLARGLNAPMQLLSATPNWNDAERVYCIHSILNPTATKGGYLNWLYEHCRTEQNPFSQTPDVTGFKDYPDAASFLADLPNVWHLPDERVIAIGEEPYDQDLPDEFEKFGFDRRNHRMIASQMEAKHTARYQGLVNPHGHIRAELMDELIEMIDVYGTVLIYADHASVARALARTLDKYGHSCLLVTGDTPKKVKLQTLQHFRTDGGTLVGTASLATGTDGLDKVCDTLIILDDTEDDSLRRQLIGRILPRGVEAPIDDKKILRFVPQS